MQVGFHFFYINALLSQWMELNLCFCLFLTRRLGSSWKHVWFVFFCDILGCKQHCSASEADKPWHITRKHFFSHVTFSSTMVHLYWIIIQELSSTGCLYTDIFYLNVSFGFRKGLSDLDGFCLAVFSIRGLHYSFSYKSNYIVLEFSGKKITCCGMQFEVFVLQTQKLIPPLLAKGFFFNPRNVSEGTRIPCGGSVDFTHEYFY